MTIILEIEQVQRLAARFVYNSYQDNSPGWVTSLLDRLQWESLQHRRWKQDLTYCYKIRNHLVDIDPTRYYTAGDIRTRGSHKARQIRAKRDQYYHSFIPRSTREWNRLPEKVVAAKSLEDFRAGLNSVPWTSP